MKRFFKPSILTIALTVATFGAFATAVAHLPEGNEEEYTWNRTGGEGPTKETNPL